MATPITGAPTIAERDAQAVRQHNMGLRHLEVVAVRVTLAIVNDEPADPADGDVYRVGNTPTGAFSGQTNKVVYFVKPMNAWYFITPVQGMVFYNLATSTTDRWNGTAWVTA